MWLLRTFVDFIGTHLVGRPGLFSPRERAKWDAWKAVEGMEASLQLNNTLLLLNSGFCSTLLLPINRLIYCKLLSPQGNQKMKP